MSRYAVPLLAFLLLTPPVLAGASELVPGTALLAEAEEFRPAGPGWQARKWGDNYFVATFANSFLSRKAFLGAPEQADRAVASLDVSIPKDGRYLALVRYEAVHRHQTQFRLRVEQAGKVVLDRPYGARDNVKIWAFGEKLKKEVAWSWGAVENIVWEGHDAFVDLKAGPARLTLVADRQPEPAARRNVDCVLLTSDITDVKNRIDKEGYLPLDGLLTQAGDLFLKVRNAAAAPLTLTVQPGTEHSPYWVHLRAWKPKALTVAPGQTTDWVEVGSLLDTLNDGQWALTAKGSGAVRYDLEFGVRNASGAMETIRRLPGLTDSVELAYDADTRTTRRIRPSEEVLYDLVAELKKQPVAGPPPRRTLVYGYTFAPRPGNAKFNEALAEFVRLTGATALGRNVVEDVNDKSGLVQGYIDVRGQSVAQLEALCQKLKAEGRADRIAVVSLGDEIGLNTPRADDHAGFRAWLRTQNVRPADLDPAAGGDVNKLVYSPTPETAKSKPGLYYYSKLYAYRHGIRTLKELTDVLRRHLPNAGIGANFSPHHGSMYLGPTHHWVSVFREDGMTMPWGEDYIWQVPVGTVQMNFLMVDLFRAGIRGKSGAKIHYYVMPHTPGNTPAAWRRQFYGDLAHGVTVFNLFEFRPVQAAYTENHCSDPAMYREVRRSLHELGNFEDLIQGGQVVPGQAALWCSEAADVWDDYRSPHDAGKRTLYIAALHRQRGLDVVVEGDHLTPYKVLYLTDRHVSRKASQTIAAWVKAGGRLFATAEAGMYDELNGPNTTLRDLLGVAPAGTVEAPEPIRFEKQDLPWAALLDRVTFKDTGKTMPVFGVRTRLTAAKDTTVRATFADGSPAVVERVVGTGKVLTCGFLPGLSYFHPALPKRPVDRGADDSTYAHFLPTQFDRTAAELVGSLFDGEPAVSCSAPLVETTLIRAKEGTVIPLINWAPTPARGLTVTVRTEVPTTKVQRASGGALKVERRGGVTVITLDLDVADALIFR